MRSVPFCRSLQLLALVFAGLMVASCSPTLNWRESRLDANGVVAMLPCKAERRERAVTLDGLALNLGMQSCEADGSIYAISSADVLDPNRVGPVLEHWQRSTAENIGAIAKQLSVAKVRGMTPNDRALLLQIDGHAPDGSALVEQSLFFVKGTRIFQAAIVARKWKQDAADTFFEGIVLP